MTKPTDFRENDRVCHAKLGTGTVIDTRGEQVTVRYDDLVAGSPVIGRYDENWFRHPDLLSLLNR